eukprot:g5858.t1 g5858   contig20:305499-308161(-)
MMWSNLGDRLANLGDAITTGASAHAKRLHEEQHQPGSNNSSPSKQTGGGSGADTKSGTVVELPPPPGAAAVDDASFSPVDTATATADQQQQQALFPGSRWTTNLTATLSDKQNQQAMIGSLRNWTHSVMESTKHIVDETREVLEKEQARIQATAPSFFSKGGGPYKRDINLPLDVEALRDAEVVYVTDRIVTLSHPYMQSTTDGDITPDRKLAAVGHLLQKRHGGRYMVWNLSEVEYESSVLDDQVLVYKFPGSPSPPLGLLLKLLMSMESWLKADERNVAVIHCLTGRGRTSTVLAAFLCWTGEAGFSDVNVALEYIARCKRVAVEALTIPSQVRYVSYFSNMLDGVRPSQPPLMLKRIIMSDAPKFGKDKQRHLTEQKIQLVKLYWDVLPTYKYSKLSGQRVSMFRCAFHTGYVPPKVLRLTKAQLDGACGDKRFSDDFFLDLIFEPCDEATASKHLMVNNEKASAASGVGSGGEDAEKENDDCANEAANRRSMGTAVDSANTFSASAYDSMLHRDSRFWDVIAARREENMKKMAELKKEGAANESETKEEVGLPLSGPTIGRRRDFSSKQSAGASADGGNASTDSVGESKANTTKKEQNPLSAFSIGEEFGMSPEVPPKQIVAVSADKPIVAPSSPPAKPKKDALMDALNDLDVDELDDDDDHELHETTPSPPLTEEVVFESATPVGKVADQEVSNVQTQPPLDTEASGEDVISEPAVPAVEQENDNVMEECKPAEVPTDNGIDASYDELLAGMDDDLANLDIDNADGDDLLGDFDGEFDDDDADLDDLENFLTNMSK